MNVAIALLGIALTLFVAIELILRRRYGTPPLYVADDSTGYRFAPNQKIWRKGNRFQTNQYSMRSDDFELKRPPETLRVLLLGDSIANSGWWTDQSQILSQIVQDELISLAVPSFSQLEVLNASANSWGPRNELGYVAKFGLFESQIVMMVLNTDDLFAVEPNSLLVGRARTHPTRRPLAVTELINRYRKPVEVPAFQILHDQPGDRVGENLEAIYQLNDLVKDQKSSLLVAITPLKREVEQGSKDNEQVARQRLQHFIQECDIPLLDFLPFFQSEDTQTVYRDQIHLSPEGNELVGKLLAQFIQQNVTSTSEVSFPSSKNYLKEH